MGGRHRFVYFYYCAVRARLVKRIQYAPFVADIQASLLHLGLCRVLLLAVYVDMLELVTKAESVVD